MANNYRKEDRFIEQPPAKRSKSNISESDSASEVWLQVNYYKVQLAVSALFVYEVQFEPPVEGYRVRTALVGQHEKVIGPFIPVGNNICVKKNLGPELDFVCTSKIESGREYKLHLKFIKDMDAINPQSFFQIYDSLIKKLWRLKKFQQLGNRGYFSPTQKLKSFPDMKLELWQGFQSALVNLQGNYGLCINLELAHKVLRKETGLDYYLQLKRERDARYAAAQLEGAIVLTRYNNRTYRVSAVRTDMTPLSIFTKPLKDGKEAQISFVDYFRTTRSLKIFDVTQPLFEVIQKKKGLDPSQQVNNNNNAASNQTTIYLVPELVTMTGLTDKMVGDFQLMRKFRDATVRNPFQRIKELNQLVTDLNTPTSEELKKELDKWGLKISREMVKVKAILFPSENILFHGTGVVRSEPGNASWNNFYSKNVQLFDKGDLSEWYLMFVDSDKDTAQDFKHELWRVAKPLGLPFPAPADELVIQKYDDRPETWISKLRSLRPTGSNVLVICMLPSQQADRYNAVKSVAVQELGYITQCVLTKNIRDMSKKKAVITKMVLQIASKLGGHPWAVTFPEQFWNVPSMIIGIDVSRSKKGTSSVGFVASYEINFCKYYSDTKEGIEHQDIVPTLAGCIKAALENFFQTHEKLPSRIVIYRDGVSEGQLGAVIEHEIPSCKAVFKNWEGYNPAFTFITVNKKSNTRLFTLDGNNPTPGTSTHDLDPFTPKRERYNIHDFFLVAQTARQGCVSPCQYHVLEDQSNLGKEVIQHITFKLCHLYPNWTGTVAVPVPIQLAHKLAYFHGHSASANAGRAANLARKLYFI